MRRVSECCKSADSAGTIDRDGFVALPVVRKQLGARVGEVVGVELHLPGVAGNRADLLPVGDAKACYVNSLAATVRSVKESQGTRLYLARHTLEEATAHGIDIAVLASK